MLYIKYHYTAKLNGANVAAFEDAEIQIEKGPETDEELMNLEETIKKIYLRKA